MQMQIAFTATGISKNKASARSSESEQLRIKKISIVRDGNKNRETEPFIPKNLKAAGFLGIKKTRLIIAKKTISITVSSARISDSAPCAKVVILNNLMYNHMEPLLSNMEIMYSPEIFPEDGIFKLSFLSVLSFHAVP
jgi:hypothetical protein